MSTLLASPVATANLSFRGLIDSERMKLLSRRSTVWVGAIIVATLLAMSLTMAFAIDGPISATGVMGLVTGGVFGAQFAAMALGAFAITGEYRTGQIRSTFNADPRRTRVLAAKGVVVAAASFLATLGGCVLALIATHIVLAFRGVDAQLFDLTSIRMLVGAAVYVAAIAVLSLAFGSMLRRSGAAIGALLVILWALPGTAVLLPPALVGPVTSFLPASAGATLYTAADAAGGSMLSMIMPTSTIVLSPWIGLIVLLAWVAVFWMLGSAVTKRRNV